MPKPFIAFIITLLLLLSGLYANHQNQKSLQPQQALTLIDFSLPDLAGTQQEISQWQGKILVINFWATWCPPCLKEIPEFIQLQDEYADKQVQFIGIATDKAHLVEDYLSFVDINYPILIAETQGEALIKQLGSPISAVPYTLVVNQQGQISFRLAGEISKQQLIAVIEPLIAN
ncbi:MAG: redoxin domain-containing protein [Methyloprofundus sp.]|nr:redoxin domain-containing protein [Methyloprofundus sp.]